ncbi:MAG: hypothetical protein AAGG02_18230 [Cyanobacteria bacterium P01_H01_bin.15]
MQSVFARPVCYRLSVAALYWAANQFGRCAARLAVQVFAVVGLGLRPLFLRSVFFFRTRLSPGEAVSLREGLAKAFPIDLHPAMPDSSGFIRLLKGSAKTPRTAAQKKRLLNKRQPSCGNLVQRQ